MMNELLAAYMRTCHLMRQKWFACAVKNSYQVRHPLQTDSSTTEQANNTVGLMRGMMTFGGQLYDELEASSSARGTCAQTGS